MRRAGFWKGVGTLFGAVKELLATPSLWRYAAVPMLTLLCLAGLGVGLVTWQGVPRALHALVGTDSEHWYARLGSAALATILWLVGCVAVLFVSWIITPVVCSPALEAIVERVEQTIGAPPQAKLSLWRSFSCGLRAQCMGLVALLPIWLGLWLLGLVLPFLAPLLLMVKLMAMAFSLAWTLLDYPLTLRGVPARQRLLFIRRNLSAVAGFGLAFACLFWIPLTAVLLLPLGVIGATRLVWTLWRAEPSSLNLPVFTT